MFSYYIVFSDFGMKSDPLTGMALKEGWFDFVVDNQRNNVY